MANYYFSEEILSIIFLLIPSTSLVRFRCVCKSWLCLISNPQFIETHLTNSKKNPSVLVDGQVIKHININPYSVYLHRPSIFKCTGILNSCNGLVCLHNSRVTYLWNPLTSLYKKLRNPRTQYLFSHAHGFGFDCVSRDYKIFRVIRYIRNENLRVLVQLYSANADSWTQFSLPNSCFYNTHHLLDIKSCGPLLNGIFYMNARSSDELVSFDVRSMVFGLVPLPRIEPQTKKSDVFDFEGSVAFILTQVDDESFISLWTLDDRISGNWTHMFSFEADFLRFKMDGLNFVPTYLGDGQFVTSDYKKGNRRMILYNCKRKRTLKFLIPNDIYSGNLFKYTESLVSIQGFQALRSRGHL